MTDWQREHDAQINLGVAALRLDVLDLYPKPVSVEKVKIVFWDWFFKIPGLRRFDGFTLCPRLIVLKSEYARDNNLYTHELTHVWQMQNEWLKLIRAYARKYENWYEREARFAVSATEDIFVGVEYQDEVPAV